MPDQWTQFNQSQLSKDVEPAVRRVDPMVKAMKRAYRQTGKFKLDQLREEQTRWLRKRTIAENKLASVRRRIEDMLAQLVEEKDKRGEVK